MPYHYFHITTQSLMIVTDAKQQQKLAQLSDYLSRNQAYLVNYQQRKKQGKPFTSQVAESQIESMINARHKIEWQNAMDS